MFKDDVEMQNSREDGYNTEAKLFDRKRIDSANSFTVRVEPALRKMAQKPVSGGRYEPT